MRNNIFSKVELILTKWHLIIALYSVYALYQEPVFHLIAFHVLIVYANIVSQVQSAR